MATQADRLNNEVGDGACSCSIYLKQFVQTHSVFPWAQRSSSTWRAQCFFLQRNRVLFLMGKKVAQQRSWRFKPNGPFDSNSTWKNYSVLRHTTKLNLLANFIVSFYFRNKIALGYGIKKKKPFVNKWKHIWLYICIGSCQISRFSGDTKIVLCEISVVISLN